jgi:hypothetical protein
MAQTRTLLTTLVLLGGLSLPLLATPAARAGLIPNKVTVAQDGSNYRWTYNVVVTSDLYLAQGDYFTIYDFAGAVNGSIVTPADWAMTSSNTTVIPPKYGNVTANDDPNIPNYTFTYTSATPVFGSSGLGNFAFITPYPQSTAGVFTSVNHRQDSSTDDPDPQEFTLTPTIVPVPAASSNTPEPATLALAIAGLPLAGLLRLRRRRR